MTRNDPAGPLTTNPTALGAAWDALPVTARESGEIDLDDLASDRLARMLEVFVFKGIAYRHQPGPPIDEAAWLRSGIVATTTGDIYSTRYLG